VIGALVRSRLARYAPAMRRPLRLVIIIAIVAAALAFIARLAKRG
jgi:hypothetical protein